MQYLHSGFELMLYLISIQMHALEDVVCVSKCPQTPQNELNKTLEPAYSGIHLGSSYIHKTKIIFHCKKQYIFPFLVFGTSIHIVRVYKLNLCDFSPNILTRGRDP